MGRLDIEENTRLLHDKLRYYSAQNPLLSIATCSSESIQITPNDIEPVRDEHSKYGVTCHGPDLHDFQWRGPYGLISQDPLLRLVEWQVHRTQEQVGRSGGPEMHARYAKQVDSSERNAATREIYIQRME
ncbi:Hypothetical protein CINCED_3A000804 [Cinara cedri]|uniref:Uncharacterized protein n=1 Tax=Cinara cedri TaxID=506608 RepID=A0A5E4NE34_9HEMI|nr:Hypothetical protein CINCED_3A000804 [Cinara cedri]